ncbi:GNAT family N-acetyltransferase [Paenibacillus elgii]|uniref:GNAT family N-acetyltransferase n=1 Tax=Paenibacillus elgii TaxID=189691 RepID=UPI000D35D88B
MGGNFIVNPYYRGLGVGKYLIEDMKKYARSELQAKNFLFVCSQHSIRMLCCSARRLASSRLIPIYKSIISITKIVGSQDGDKLMKIVSDYIIFIM